MPPSPIYIVSKGRWDSSLTSKALDALGLGHYVVVEEQEAARYRAALPPTASVLILERCYQQEYDTCDHLGDSKSKGPGPARNFVWDHSLGLGASWHWVMDDNIRWWCRLNRNLKVPVTDGAIFQAMEDFVQRYTNVVMAGPAYELFTPRKAVHPPFILNTRIYSCNLIRNDAPYRWRGRYNEDTDLSLRMLKDGLVTVQFNAFLQKKVWTQTMRGGNTTEFYEKEGTLPKSQMLVRLHPDCARLVWRFQRWHHYVDYSRFHQQLRRKPSVAVPSGPNEYGMVFRRKVGAEWVNAEAAYGRP